MRFTAAWLVVCAAALAADPAKPGYTITTVAGGTECGQALGAPEGLVADSGGNLYIADAIDHRVRKLAPDGTLTVVAGDGHPGFRGDGGPAILAQLSSPYGLALSTAGTLYIADYGNGRVREVTADGLIRTVAGGGEITADWGDATSARLDGPRNVAVDAVGNLYISDFNEHRIYRVTNGLIYRIAGVGAAGSIGGNATVEAALAPLNSPAGLAVDYYGSLYIADAGNAAVRKIDGGRMSTIAISGPALVMPKAVALDSRGTLYIADEKLGTVMKVASGEALAVAGGDTGLRLAEPRALTLDNAGTVWIGDRESGWGVVHKLLPDGLMLTAAGGVEFRPVNDGGPATSAHLSIPSGVSVDEAGNLYISDRGHQRVRRVSTNGIIATVAGTGQTGSSGDGGPGAEATLNQPDGISADAWGNIWFAEFGAHRVRALSASGWISALAGSGEPGYSGDGAAAARAALRYPEGVTVRGGAIFIADTFNHVIRKVAGDGTISTVAGNGEPGYAGDGGPATTAMLNFPKGVAVDEAGNIYIADSGNNAVRKVTPAGLITTVAGTGIPTFGGDGGPASEAQLYWPSRVALDASGNLYIADTMNQRIRRINPEGIIETIAGNGTAGYSGDGGPASEAQLDEPYDVALDTAGNVYIADRGNDLIRKLTPPAPEEPDDVAVFAVVNAASMQRGSVAPGEIVAVFGYGLGPGIAQERQVASPGMLATNLAGTEILFDGRPAPLLYAQYGQVNAVVPYAVAGQTATELELRLAGVTRARVLLTVAATSPAFFVTSGGQAVATNEDRTPNSPDHPALRGTLLTLFATGEGETSPAGVDGRLAADPYPRPVAPVSLRIGGQEAQLVYAGSAPGYVGVFQITARVPEQIPAGKQAVELTVGAAQSPGGVVVAVR